MTRLLTWLLGRLPIGWMQLVHNRTRLIAAVGGVTFANVLIFMQLGFMNALFETSVLQHRRFAADIVVVSSDFKSLREANPLPRGRMHQALRVPGVVDATPVYQGTLTWPDPATGDTTNFRLTGVDPEATVFVDAELADQIELIREPNSLLIDRRTRDFNVDLGDAVVAGERPTIEIAGRQLTVVGLFDQGASFDVDGAVVVSDQTFMRLFPKHVLGAPTLLLLTCKPGEDVEQLASRVQQQFTEDDAVALTKQQFIIAEQSYQASQTPIGFVFGFGVVIGFVVGLVIVYQVLSTDVQGHLAEYATFKAIGYSPRFFHGVVVEEAVGLAALGFLPGLLISGLLYYVASQATALPISMPWHRPLLVFVLTVVMCVTSGAIATRRLNSADPAELF